MNSLKILFVVVSLGAANLLSAQDVARPDHSTKEISKETRIVACENIEAKQFNYVPAGNRCKIGNDVEIERVEIRREDLPSFKGWRFHSEKLDKSFQQIIWLDLESNQLGRSFAFNKGVCREQEATVPTFEQQQIFIKNGGSFILGKSPYVKLATEGKLNNLNLLSNTANEEGHPLTTNIGSPERNDFSVDPNRGAKNTKAVDASLCIRTAR